MDVWTGRDPDEFAARARGYLRTERMTTNVIGVHLAGVMSGARPPGPDDLWAAIGDDSGIVGAAMHTPPNRLFLGRMPAKAAAALAGCLAALGRRLPGANGELATVSAFADAWQEQTGHASERLTAMRMYRLDALAPPSDGPGQARAATAGDLPLVEEWFGAFHDEALHDLPHQDPAVLRGRVAAGLLMLWEREEARRPLSLAGFSRPSSGVSRIGPVYTPPDARRQGYGSAVTAAATRAALDLGAAEVVLYTDLDNPTSNSIYQQIGYRPDHDAEERRFAP